MNKMVVLVVEDDRPIRNLIVTTLKMHDYKYLTANNGASAIMEASSHHPDIVLLDLGLPDMEGVDVIKKIRTWSNMPIIVISARSEDSDKIEALDSGADDYITKPFGIMELISRVKAILRRINQDEEEKQLVFQNITLYCAMFTDVITTSACPDFSSFCTRLIISSASSETERPRAICIVQ